MFDVESARVDLIATGGQDFDIDFPIYSKNDIDVYVERLIKTVDLEYTVRTLGGGAPFETIAQNNLPALATVRFPVAPTNGFNINIVAVREIVQQSEYETAPLSPRRVERDFDKAIFIARMLGEKLGRALQFNPWSLQRDMFVPEPEETKALGWIGGLLTNIPSGKGDKGDTGDNGVSPVFRAAAGVPTNDIGVNGDVYINSSNGNLYLKSAGVYTLVANLIGPPGAGAAPTVQELDGSPSIGLVSVIQFDQDAGLTVTAPGGTVARISLAQGAIGSALRVTTTAAAARAVLDSPALAGDNIYTGRQQGSKGTNIASATAITPATNGNYFHVTGTTNIETIATLAAGTPLTLVFDGILTLVHSSNLILLGGVNFTTAAGVACEFRSEGSGVWREINRHTPTAASVAMQEFSTSTTWVRGTATKVLISASAPGGGGGGSSSGGGSGGGGAGECLYRALVEVSSDLTLTIPAGGATEVDGGTLTIVGTGVSISLQGGKHGIGGGSGGTGGNGGGSGGGVGPAAGTVGVKGDPESAMTQGGASGGGANGNGGPSVTYPGGTKGTGGTNGGGGGGASIFAKGGDGGNSGAVGSVGTKGSGGGGAGAGGFIAGGAGGAGFIRIEVVA